MVHIACLGAQLRHNVALVTVLESYAASGYPLHFLESATETLQLPAPALVLLHWQHASLAWLAEMARRHCVVVLSDSVDTAAEQQLWQQGIAALLTTPLDPAIVARQLQQQLRFCENQQALQQAQQQLEHQAQLIDSLHTSDNHSDWLLYSAATQAPQALGTVQHHAMQAQLETQPEHPQRLERAFAGQAASYPHSLRQQRQRQQFVLCYIPLGQDREQPAAPVNAVLLRIRDVSHEQDLQHLADFRNQLISIISTLLQQGASESFYQTLLDKAVEAIPQVDAGSLLLRMEDGRYHFVASHGFVLEQLQQVSFDASELFVRPGDAYRVVHHHELHKGNAQSLEPARQDIFDRYGRLDEISVSLIIPIHIQGSMVATLNLNSFQEQDDFDDDAKAMADAFAGQMGVVLKSLQQGQQLRQQAHFLSRLMPLSNLQPQDSQHVYQQLLEAAIDTIPEAQAGSLLLLKDKRFHFVAAQGFDLAGLQPLTFSVEEMQYDFYPDNYDKRAVVVRQEEYRRVSLDPQRLAILQRYGRIDAIHNTLSVPIRIGDPIVAVLNLDSFHKGNSFSQQSRQNAELFAEYLAISLQRQRLEQQLQERIAFRQALAEVMAHSLQQSLDQDFYQRLLDTAVAVIPSAEGGSIIVRHSTGYYYFVAANRHQLAPLQGLRLSADDLLIPAERREACIVDDLARHEQHLSADKRAQLEQARHQQRATAVLCSNVFVDAQNVAVLYLDNFSHGSFDAEAVAMAEIFAAQVGVLLKQRRLETQLHNRADFLQQLADITHDSLQRGFDANFYQRILEAAVRVIPDAETGNLLLRGNDDRYRYIASVGFDLAVLQKIEIETSEFSMAFNTPKAQRALVDWTTSRISADKRSKLEHAGPAAQLQVAISVAIMHEARPVAVLRLHNLQNKHAFDDEALAMAEAFAAQISVLLWRLQLEEKLRQRTAFLQGLSTLIERGLVQQLNAEFYSQLLEQAIALIPGAEAGSILRREADGYYCFVAAQPYSLATLADIRLAPHELAQHPQQAKVQLLSHIHHNPNVAQHKRQQISRAQGSTFPQATLNIPVLHKQQALLFVNLDNLHNSFAFDDASLAMAELFAQQVAVLQGRLELESQLRQRQVALEHANRQLYSLANYDPLTQLPNRSHFSSLLQQAIANSNPRKQNSIGLLAIDLNGFKYINDTFGHDIGDQVLLTFAKRLRAVLPAHGRAARLGGDEFSVMLPGLSKPQDGAILAQAVLQQLQQPVILNEQQLFLSAGIGIACYPQDANSAGDLLQVATIAMVHAKRKLSSNYHFYSYDLRQRSNERLLLENDIRQGLLHQEFVLHYQPRIHLRDLSVHSLEALLRWQHPQRGWMLPGKFIPLAEDTGLIEELGHYALEQACKQLRAWRRAGIAQRIAVNLSAKQLQRPQLVADMVQVLRHYELEASWLELEITESTAMDNIEENIRSLQQLKQLGVHLSIDDFGTAYSSLSQLKRLPFDSLKIDAAFVRDLDNPLHSHKHNQGLIQAIISLARSFDLEVVAEGVETAQQACILQKLGCDYAQGFLFCRPISADALQPLLERGYVDAALLQGS